MIAALPMCELYRGLRKHRSAKTMKRFVTLFFLALMCASYSPASGAQSHSAAAAAGTRASQKMEKKQRKAMKKYQKAQKKAQRKMVKKDRKNTHDPNLPRR
jgi:hypothetical protein